MKKIKSLFKRNYSGDRLVYDEIVPGVEWVVRGEGIATLKYDGTCCLIRDGKLFKRYDRKMTRKNYKRLKSDPSFEPEIGHYKPAPDNWEAAEVAPNHYTGHWPGWVPVGDGPEDQWHQEAFHKFINSSGYYPDGTRELIGPKIQANPYDLEEHMLVSHSHVIWKNEPPRTFEGLKEFFKTAEIEGIVWHHPDGRMVKIKRRDFGYPWPLPRGDNMKRGVKFLSPDNVIAAMVQSGEREAIDDYHQLLIEHGYDPNKPPPNKYDFNRGFEYGIQWALDNPKWLEKYK